MLHLVWRLSDFYTLSPGVQNALFYGTAFAFYAGGIVTTIFLKSSPLYLILMTSYFAAILLVTNILYFFGIHYRIITEQRSEDVTFSPNVFFKIK
jgi:hypothetical protein